MRSLFVRLYLGCILALLLGGAAASLLFVSGDRISRSHEKTMHLARVLVSDLWLRRDDPKAMQSKVDPLNEHLLAVSFYDPDGHLLLSTVSPPLPMAEPRLRQLLSATDEIELGRQQLAIAVREHGRLVSVGVVLLDGFPFGKLAPRAAVILMGFLAFAVLFARHLAKPLQHLTNTARRFGRGELSARARLSRRDEVGELGRAFDEMADRIKLLMASQQELLANVSHELQTPIARIHVALEHIAVRGLDKARELLPEIEIDLAELQRLFDDVMLVARLDLSRSHEPAAWTPLRIEPIALESLLQRMATRFRAECQTHTLVLDAQPGLPELQADRILLRRAIDNLVENARKYSEPGSTILVSATACPKGVKIAVIDHGMGMEAADLKQVFMPFFRSDRSRSRQTGGVGLGLALARRVIEAHGGTIELISSPNIGTTAVIEVPIGGESTLSSQDGSQDPAT